jgi:rfaE bifunctional protein nucleotidyltransferase chain/domain
MEMKMSDYILKPLEKFYNIEDFLVIRKSLDQPLILTNGCFDMIHIAHVYNLQESKNIGGKLLVCVNTDESVKKLKGEGRPIQNLSTRIYMLGSLACVDFIISFNETNLVNIIKMVKPDIWTKGSDYNLNTINRQEKKALNDVGSNILFVDNSTLKNITTTNNIGKYYE